jgi:arylsulfatase A-like enzyme
MRVAIGEGMRGGKRPAGDFAAEMAFLRDLYREEVAYLDALLARLFARVAASGRPTLILFVGDHGEAFGEHGNLEHRWTLNEEELRVPFILAGPGVPQGRELGFAPELVDGARTLLELCGLADAAADGRNVLAERPEVLPAGEEPLSFMVYRATVREGRWKLVSWVCYGEDAADVERMQRSFKPGEYEHRPLALYDLAADPAERHNLIAPGAPLTPELEAVLMLLRKRLDERMARDFYPSLGPRLLNPKQRDQLGALGYAAGAEDSQ